MPSQLVDTPIAAVPPATIALLAVLAAVEVGLLAWALVDLARRPATQVTGGRKLPWLILCLLLQFIGPVVYLAAGRERQATTTAEAAPPSVPRGGPDGTTPSKAAHDVVAALFAHRDDAEPATAPPAVEIAGLRKSFGRTSALDDLSLSVPQGSVYGFLGPNGAGKTTTLRILAGLAHADGGSVRILGREVAESGADTRSLIGYLPDVPSFYKWMTAPEYLRFAGGLFGLSGAALDTRVAALLELAGLSGVRTKVGGFSRGMKQRLGVAQALINGPQLLLLDEPTSALDPIGRRDVLDMVASLRGRTTVFFSTHILADVERVCDTVAVIARGRVAAEAGIDELRRRRGGRHRLIVAVDDGPRLAAALEGATWLRTVELSDDGAVRVTADDLAAAQRELPALVAGLGLSLSRFANDELSLEDVFLDLVRESTE